VWAGGSDYRVLPLGGVRTLLGERRVDATPLVRPPVTGPLDGGRRLGLATRKWELATRTGKLALEQGHVANAGDGGLLLCRLLVEIVASDPLAAPCATDEVPLHAQFSWPQGGSVVFEATALADRNDLPAAQLLVPPAGATFETTGIPAAGTGVILSREEMGAMRRGPVDVAAVTSPGAPPEGLVAYNSTEVMRYVFVDSLPMAWVLPGHEAYPVGAPRGRYAVQWRTFLDDAVEPVRAVELPARVAVGIAADAGK